MSKVWETLELVLGVTLLIAGILAVIYFLSPNFQKKINNTAAEIGAGNNKEVKYD